MRSIPNSAVALALAMVMSLTGMSAFAADAGMTTWTVKAGRFSVAMPGKPEYKSQEYKLPTGDTVVRHNYTFETADGKYAYMVEYSDRTAGWNLDGVVSGWGKSGRTSNTRSFTLDGKPGRQAEVETDGYRTYMYAILDGTRIYQVAFIAPMNGTVPPEANQFVLSFKITD
jgi:hypothetical protein